MFLKIDTVYICPECGKAHEIKEEFEGDPAMFDSGIEIECTCGLTFTMRFDFN